MGRFSLRYQAIDLPIDEGGLVVGRTDLCGLRLDDPLVSRRHAEFRDADGTLEVIDLDSRNGVYVNGKRIDGRIALKEGDRVKIGSQELTVRPSAGQRRLKGPGTKEIVTCTLCGHANTARDPVCSQCGAPTDSRATHADMPAPLAGESGKTGSSFGPLASLADKALGMGRAAEAERVLQSALGRVLSQAEGGVAPDDARVRDAVSYALQLTEAGKRASWLDYVFRLHTALGRMMSAEDIDEVYRLAEAIRYKNPRPVRSYVEELRRQSQSLRPNERFLLQRLEGLERKVGSG